MNFVRLQDDRTIVNLDNVVFINEEPTKIGFTFVNGSRTELQYDTDTEQSNDMRRIRQAMGVE